MATPTARRSSLRSCLPDLTRGGDPVAAILGSGRLIHTLFPHGLIDEHLLLVHPLVLGAGLRLFPEGAPATLRLRDSVATPKGVVLATHETAR